MFSHETMSNPSSTSEKRDSWLAAEMAFEGYKGHLAALKREIVSVHLRRTTGQVGSTRTGDHEPPPTINLVGQETALNSQSPAEQMVTQRDPHTEPAQRGGGQPQPPRKQDWKLKLWVLQASRIISRTLIIAATRSARFAVARWVRSMWRRCLSFFGRTQG